MYDSVPPSYIHTTYILHYIPSVRVFFPFPSRPLSSLWFPFGFPFPSFWVPFPLLSVSVSSPSPFPFPFPVWLGFGEIQVRFGFVRVKNAHISLQHASL